MAVPPMGSSSWMVCVVGNVVRNVEETFLDEVSLIDEENINVMCKKKHLKFVSVL
jgi:hypothetical protein